MSDSDREEGIARAQALYAWADMAFVQGGKPLDYGAPKKNGAASDQKTIKRNGTSTSRGQRDVG